MIAVVEYGMGNLRSVMNALTALGLSATVAHDPGTLASADAVVLPGVGAFGDGMRNLKDRGFVPVLEERVLARGIPFLGICLGMELLATTSTELGLHHGLGWIPGHVDRLRPADPTLRVPHIGWNDVAFRVRDGLYAGLGDRRSFYFVHSYVFVPDDPSVVSGVCDYGEEFAASIESGNIAATQFHPEKSHDVGLAVLRNFFSSIGAAGFLRSV